MRVLVTGHRGYIGSVLTNVLSHAHYDVVGLDSDLCRGCDFGRTHTDTPSFDLDIRDVEFTDLLSFDAVVHLAALSDDASAELDSALTCEINCEATIRLAECCKQADVSRFVFASTCGVYGRGGFELFDEKASPNPSTECGRSKWRCEQDLARLADNSFCPVFLRNATVYGVSPRLRVDTTVNNFVASAVAFGQVMMSSIGRAWQPLIHVEDLARAYATVLAAPTDVIHNQVFNIVRTDENYRVIDVADAVTEFVPQCTRSTPRDALDHGWCRADGSRLLRTFPRLDFHWTLPLGIRQLYSAMLAGGFTPADWRSDRYRRALRLVGLMERGQLSDTLRAHAPVDL